MDNVAPPKRSAESISALVWRRFRRHPGASVYLGVVECYPGFFFTL